MSQVESVKAFENQYRQLARPHLDGNSDAQKTASNQNRGQQIILLLSPCKSFFALLHCLIKDLQSLFLGFAGSLLGGKLGLLVLRGLLLL